MDIDICRYIDDATLLGRYNTYEDIMSVATFCGESKIKGICCHPCDTADCSEILEGTETSVVTVISFPFGLDTIDTKLFSIEDAIENGTTEIDYVINMNAVKDGEFLYIAEEATLIGNMGVASKAIIEISLLSPKEIKSIAEVLNATGVDYIKTCTGKLPDSYKLSFDDKLKRLEIAKKNAPKKKIKFSGGVKTLSEVERLISLGIDRIGTSNTFQIVKDNLERQRNNG